MNIKKTFSVFAFAMFSLMACKMAASGISILSGDFEAPKMLSMTVQDEKHIFLSFSKEVNAKNASLYRLQETGERSQNASDYFQQGFTLNDGGEELQVSLSQPSSSILELTVAGDGTIPGERYALDGAVIDKSGNSLLFAGLITGYNSRVPKMRINEMRASKSGNNTKFVELKMLSSGNISGVALVLAANSNDVMRYEFPNIEVKKGDFCVLHMIPDGEEIPDNENAQNGKRTSTYSSASDAAWDFFISDKAFALSSTTAAMLVETRENGDVVDSVLICKSGRDEWTKLVQKDVAKRAFESGKWAGGDTPNFAFPSDKLSSGASLVRRNGDAFGAGCWERLTAKNATPGAENE